MSTAEFTRRCGSPRSGQYLQPDPIGLAGGLNQYSYAADNPVAMMDPLGLLVLLTSRDLGTNATFGIGTHQYFILIPDNPGDFEGRTPSMRDLGGGKRGYVIGAHNVKGRLKAKYFEDDDLFATKELFEPDRYIHWYKSDLDADPHRCNSARTDTELINAILVAIDTYMKMEAENPISYGWPFAGQPNSNSWAQSVKRYVGAYGPQDLRGRDIYRNLVIPPGYFNP